MRPLWKDVLVAIWLGMILPGFVLNAFVLKERQRHNRQAQAVQVQLAPKVNRNILLKDQDGTYHDMDLDAYLTGVLLAEMPAEFHEEALKAQAVAARTFTWKAYTTGGKHGDSSVCTDASCCQAYLAKESYLSCGGTQENLQKVQRAVASTSSMVLIYDGELIEATYFSSSGGSTEAAAAVWGTDYPYLQAVSSPEEEPQEYVVRYTVEEFQNLLGRKLTEQPAEWIQSVEYTEGGGVASMEICGESHTGVELRSLLGLRSTAFQVAVDEESIAVITRGYGHRVGMSQHGANALAQAGNTWQKILQHYYPGTSLVPAY